MPLRSAFLSAAACFFSCTAAVLAQSNPADQPPTLKTTARDVVVDVVVTQGAGDPVLKLQKGDFQIFEDGKPQNIDFFEEHTAKTLPAGALADLPKMPPNVYTNVPRAPESDAVNVLLLDSLNTPPQMTSYARNQILAYLNHVKPGTRMAIFALNDKLSIVQGFTADAALLREVATKQTAPGVSPSLVTKNEIAGEQELESFLNSNAPANPGSAPAGGPSGGGNAPSGAGWANPSAPMTAITAVANAFANYQSFNQANRTRMTLEALSDIARYLAAVPGRKNLIWFSGDFPVFIFPKFDQRQDYADNSILLSQVQRTADLLTAARVAVYPIFANGMMTEDIVSADNRSPASAAGPGNLAQMSGNGIYTSSSDERASAIAAMNQIASDTGGKAAYNTNDLDAATQHAIADGSHYYTLAYSPANKKMDGKYRKVEVKLTTGKYRLDYRRGYNADDSTKFAAAKPASDPLTPLLIRGLPCATQILYGARVLPASPQPAPNATRAGKNPKLKGPVTRYAIDLMIRWTDVALNPEPDGAHTGKLQLGMIAYDREGKALNWNGATEQMSLNPETFAAIQKSGVPAHLEIDVPNSEAWLEIGVYDWNTGKAGTLEVPLHASANAALQTQPSTPKSSLDPHPSPEDPLQAK